MIGTAGAVVLKRKRRDKLLYPEKVIFGPRSSVLVARVCFASAHYSFGQGSPSPLPRLCYMYLHQAGGPVSSCRRVQDPEHHLRTDLRGSLSRLQRRVVLPGSKRGQIDLLYS